MKSWKELDVWQKTHALVLRVYEVTAQFPAAERYRAEAQRMTEKKLWTLDS